MSQSQSSLRFSLEESIWFKKGQEVEELLSISLDPDITIQEQEQYIQIIGSLQLSGEYRGNPEDENDLELDLHGKFAHHVEYRLEEDVFYFQHRFPVDVTIPKNRINHLDDIDVMIDSFDYVLPGNDQLNLNADLSILGIRNEENEIEEEQKEEVPITFSRRESYEVVNEESSEEINNIESSANHAKSINESSEDWTTDDEVESAANYQFTRLPVENDIEKVEAEVEEDIYEPFIVEARKSPEEQKEFEIEKEVQEHPLINVEKQDEPALNLGVVEEEEIIEEVLELTRQSTESSDEQDFESPVHVESNEDEVDDMDNDEIEEVKKKKKKLFGKTESISLADFFARKADEKAAKLKVCIVQHGETLDYLAEKYDISVQQILRMNHLEMNQDVHEGQVLYIPSYATTLKSEK
ncbi:stage VI sporulation protein D [Heyndrickxia sporothermodurans]|nr:stage VI sporulation protein D [Heyndrickxia sporothermodurans]